MGRCLLVWGFLVFSVLWLAGYSWGMGKPGELCEVLAGVSSSVLEEESVEFGDC